MVSPRLRAGRDRPTRTRNRSRTRASGRTPWLDWMALPTLLVLAVVIAYPIVRAVWLSFTDYNLITGDARTVGSRNYTELARDATFWEAVRNTVVFTGCSVAGALLLGLLLALLTENRQGGWRYLRGAMLTPWAVPVIVVAFLFRYIFERDGGVANALLVDLGLLDQPGDWLTSTTWAMPVVVLTNIWSQAPFFLLLFTAALAGVPQEVVEAARVDRLRGWHLLWRVKLPYLRPAAAVGAMLMVINNFNNFPLIWSMTQGGPANETTTLVVYVYRLAFTTFDLGYASAVGVVWLVLLLLVVAWFVRLTTRTDGKDEGTPAGGTA